MNNFFDPTNRCFQFFVVDSFKRDYEQSFNDEKLQHHHISKWSHQHLTHLCQGKRIEKRSENITQTYKSFEWQKEKCQIVAKNSCPLI